MTHLVGEPPRQRWIELVATLRTTPPGTPPWHMGPAAETVAAAAVGVTSTDIGRGRSVSVVRDQFAGDPAVEALLLGL